MTGRAPTGQAGQASPGAAKASPPFGDHPSRMAFNVNDLVWIKLTGAGRDILAKRESEFNRLYMPSKGGWFPKSDADGWSKWQLWQVMSEFGADCFNGCKVPFETTILLDAKALSGAIPCDTDGSPKGTDPQGLDGEAATAGADEGGIAQGPES